MSAWTGSQAHSVSQCSRKLAACQINIPCLCLPCPCVAPGRASQTSRHISSSARVWCSTIPVPARTTCPLQHFALNMDLAVAVYVDYLIKPDMIHDMLRRLSATTPELQRISPRDLACRTWADFWPEDSRSLLFAKPTRSFGFMCDLQIHPERSTRLIYLATEGHKTYQNLLGTRLQPDLVVLQDHGFGGNWRDFGGFSPMYRMARAASALPPLLFSAGENTRVWPGYQAIGEPVLLRGQMHQYERRLYQHR